MRLMPAPNLSPRAWTLPLAAALLGLALTAHTVQTASSASAKPKPTANATPPEPEIPKSTFVVPATSAEGRDPFFPLSTRLRPAPPTVTPTTHIVTPAVVQLDLKGISGTVDHRLAIINNRTFALGEEEELSVSSGRVRVLCKEIKADSVIVLVNGQERVLRLRPGS